LTGPITPGSGRHFVVDASAVVALLTDAGPAGEWVTGIVHHAALSAPELMQYEAANVLRRRSTAGSLDASAAALAHDHLISLGVEFYPYLVTAHRVWELRQNLTAYDASYVALAEQLDTPLVTLDARIARATGPRCEVMAYRPPPN
jgi:predicted nucleic acid-binding protein